MLKDLAQHGLTAEDGVSQPYGNFENLLFLWDIIFGTVKITGKYPERSGVWNQLREPWYVQLQFLFIKNDYDSSIDFEEFKKQAKEQKRYSIAKWLF